MDEIKMILDGKPSDTAEMDEFFMKKYNITEKDVENFDLDKFLEINRNRIVKNDSKIYR